MTNVRPQDGRAGDANWSRRGYLRLLVTVVILLISCHDVVAQGRKSTEYDVKAAYLYNFGKFIRWPASLLPASHDTFAICVLGKNPFGEALDRTVKGESIEGKRLEVRYLGGVSEMGGCRIVFLSNSEERRVDAVLAEVGKRPILTVSDIPDFVDRGGDIEFVEVGDKIRFKVNLGAAEKAGLSLSSELLKVAVAVKRNGQSGD